MTFVIETKKPMRVLTDKEVIMLKKRFPELVNFTGFMTDDTQEEFEAEHGNQG